ncbi:RNA polymerase sigma factor RpoH [Oligella urethralis]|uniref:RNA polymerase sigma factor RpoH n=1 Tax=Oligella urethralis TaxID=90245 RepID=UPI00037AC664|nr:RNA polymerase sigma factor RpoH [Oligella urethralis]SUA68829.1 Heat shock regulatory protein F33.4 [Oligella urethralis]
MTNQALALHNRALATLGSGAIGSIESYISSVNQIPMLTPEEEREYAERLQYQDDIQAAQALVLSHLRLVVSIARQYLGYGLPHADLIQEGNIGLMKAVKRFDVNRGVRLVSFAVHWIKAEIHEYVIRNWRMVRIATTKAQRKLFFNLRSLRLDSSTLAPEEIQGIADKLNVKPDEVVEMEIRLSGRDMSLDPGPSSRADDDEFTPIDYLSDEGESSPYEIIARREHEELQTHGLAAALESLDPRSRRIVEARWLQDDGGLTLHQLADEFGVSAERIRQIEAAAMKKMRSFLGEDAMN